jgi:hypothetical protein
MVELHPAVVKVLALFWLDANMYHDASGCGRNETNRGHEGLFVSPEEPQAFRLEKAAKSLEGSPNVEFESIIHSLYASISTYDWLRVKGSCFGPLHLSSHRQDTVAYTIDSCTGL